MSRRLTDDEVLVNALERCRPRAGCWGWVGPWTTNRKRRPRYHGQLAYRLTYKALRGPLPDDVPLDHVVCNNPECPNPWHVEPSTTGENTRRHYTEGELCRKGLHPRSESVRVKRPDRNEGWRCVPCSGPPPATWLIP